MSMINRYIDNINKGGRPPRWNKPEDLWRKFCEYAKAIQEEPIELPQQLVKGQGSTIKTGRVARPLTLQGFMCWAQISSSWSTFKRDLAGRDGFSSIISNIELAIRSQQIEGGLAGVYNSNLTARLNGLSDKTDIQSGGKPLDLTVEIVEAKQ